MSDRGIYARPVVAAPDLPAVAGDYGRTVLLVAPGVLVYLTPAEALHLAGQLRGAVEDGRAAERDGGDGECPDW